MIVSKKYIELYEVYIISQVIGLYQCNKDDKIGPRGTDKIPNKFFRFCISATGPVTYKAPDDREDFVAAIGALGANGGGDCPELTFQGMLDAFRPEPQIGSPMFVFTDATPKDATTSNINKLKW